MRLLILKRVAESSRRLALFASKATDETTPV